MEPIRCEDSDSELELEKDLDAANEGNHSISALKNALLMVIVFLGIWQLGALYYNHLLLLPGPLPTAIALKNALLDPEVWKNLLITMRRVLAGFSIAIMIGLPLGFLMGFSRTAMQFLEPLINSLRQVPIMAWVPLTIVWFGLGDGPTVFLIAFSGLFPVLLSTVAGVQSISQDYYNAARSMGADGKTILFRVIIPGSLPDVLTGMRLALSAGWMSVICAEFIATSAGFGYSMVQAQSMLETDTLMALMIMAALIGYGLDRLMVLIMRRYVHWKYA